MFVVSGLVTVTFAAAGTPKRVSGPVKVSATGKIVALTRTGITIESRHDLRCKLGTVVPKALGFRIGASAKIVCVKGILRKIRPIPRKAVTATTPGTGPPATATLEPDPTTYSLLPPPRLK